MNKLSSDTVRGDRAVANWILIGVGWLLIQIILGGITRLTGSGLSITEWKPIMGVLPPLNEQKWQDAFAKYQQIAQYKYINSHFTLTDFKHIFFWEWFHRLWAILLGVVFVFGFVYLLWKKYLRKGMIKPLLILFLLGALQGRVGWFMVATGLTGDALYVEPTSLALHFICAMGLICYAFWFGLQLRVPSSEKVSFPGLRNWTWVITGILLLQLIFGALMAGNKAATAAPTWPTINGSWVPGGMLKEEPAMRNLADNSITIHFIHRGLAYLLTLLIFFYTVKAYKIHRATRAFSFARRLPLLLILVQVILGVLAVLKSPGIIPHHWGAFEWLAQLHQVNGMLLLLSLLSMLYLTSKPTFKQPL